MTTSGLDDHTPLAIAHVIHSLERIEVRLEKLSDEGIVHSRDIADIQVQLDQTIADLNKRIKPIEEVLSYLNMGSRVVRWTIAAVVAIGGFFSALAILKDRLW